MSRTTTNTFKSAVFAQDTNETFLILITIDHDDLDAPIRVSSDNVDTTSNGNTFVAFPFDLVLADDDENASPRARLSIDNVDRQIVLAVRTITSAPSVLVQIVLASDTDTIEASFPDFKLENISYNDLTVSGDLTLEEFTTEPYPSGTFTPADFAGMF